MKIEYFVTFILSRSEVFLIVEQDFPDKHECEFDLDQVVFQLAKVLYRFNIFIRHLETLVVVFYIALIPIKISLFSENSDDRATN